jgi:hypothetical protein
MLPGTTNGSSFRARAACAALINGLSSKDARPKAALPLLKQRWKWRRVAPDMQRRRTPTLRRFGGRLGIPSHLMRPCCQQFKAPFRHRRCGTPWISLLQHQNGVEAGHALQGLQDRQNATNLSTIPDQCSCTSFRGQAPTQGG